MNALYVFTFLPISLFGFLLWSAVRKEVHYTNRQRPLFFSLFIFTLVGLLQLPLVFGREIYSSVAESNVLLAVLFLFLVSFLLLEYSIHVERIRRSAYLKAFQKRLRLSVLGQYLMLVMVLAAIGLRVANMLSSTRPAESYWMSTIAAGVFVLLYGFVLMFTTFGVYSFREGIIRVRHYTYFLQLVVGVFMTLVYAISSPAAQVPFFVLIILTVTYVVRLFLEYYHYRNLHLTQQIDHLTVGERERTDIINRAITTPLAEDLLMIKDMIEKTMSSFKEAVVTPNTQVTGIVLFRRKGNKLIVDSPEMVFGYATPFALVANIRRATTDQLRRTVSGQVFDLDALVRKAEPDLARYGELQLKRLIDTKSAVRAEELPEVYRTEHRLVLLMPIINSDEISGVAVVYKDGFDQLYPEEQRGLEDLLENLNVVFSIMRGKEIQRERDRLQGEMEIARQIQTSIVPKSLEMPGYDAACTMITATEVGGDIFDFIRFGARHYIAVGDVAGHGLPAGIMALIEMAAMQSAIATMKKAGAELRISGIYDVVNEVLCEINRNRIGSDKFMTGNVFSEENGTFTYAGTHLIALLYRAAENRVEQLTGTINRTAYLGISEFINSRESEGTFTTAAGDVLMLYTDGVIEAMNGEEQLFGVDRLAEAFAEHAAGSSAEIIESVTREVFRFAEHGDCAKHAGHLADDVSLVVLKRL